MNKRFVILLDGDRTVNISCGYFDVIEDKYVHLYYVDNGVHKLIGVLNFSKIIGIYEVVEGGNGNKD